MPPLQPRSISEPLIHAPGMGRLYTNNMLDFGRQLRDRWLWEFPIMPEAVYIFQQMASGREYKVSGAPRGVVRCIEWMNRATTKQYDGITAYGFDDFERRRALDHLTIGRTVLYAPPNGDLEYLDPTNVYFDYMKQVWYSTLTGMEYPERDIFASNAIPIGSSGIFMSPLAPVVPAAMLQWLVREHDKASVDGRKIRDVIIVQGEDVATRAVKAIADMIKIYTEPDATKHSIPVIFYEGGDGLKASDLVGRIGISNIPEGFNRADSEFGYVNEIAGALGLSLRHFWNSEKATNRALEEVQEARQAQKGPSYFVRNEQRLFNNGKIVQRFGRNVRVNFVEEVDVQSRETNARVLKLYAESVVQLNSLAPGLIDVAALIGFMQRDDILPADIELINPSAQPPSAIQASDQQTTPGKKVKQASSDPGPTIHKALDLDYDEVVMDLNYRVLERRSRVYSVQKALAEEIEKDPIFIEDTLEKALEAEEITIENMLEKAHTHNLAIFLKTPAKQKKAILAEHPLEIQERLNRFTKKSKLTDDDHRVIASVVIGILTTE